jgi:hypothetical protein
MTLRLFRRPRHGSRGQSIVEFALVLPIMLFLFVGIVDLGRVYTAMIGVESAAREAADYGTFGSDSWAPVLASVPGGTVEQMHRRGCVAARNLPDYVGPDDNCTNPEFSWRISGDQGNTWFTEEDLDLVSLACNNRFREPPCRVEVTMEYDFALLIPLGFQAFGVRYGLPEIVTFQRMSTFAMTDLQFEEPTASPE